MRTALLCSLLMLALAPAVAAAECAPPVEPGFVVAVCEGEAQVGEAERLRDVRVTGNGTAATVYVAKLSPDGLLLESTLGPEELPAGVPLEVFVTYEGGLLEHGSEDIAVAPARASRVFRSPETPLSEAAAPAVSSACLAFRRAVGPHLVSAGIEGYLRQVRAFRRARATLTRRFTAAATTAADRRVLLPPARALRAGNRHLAATERILERTHDARRTVRSMRRYERTLPRTRRLLRRFRMSECSP